MNADAALQAGAQLAKGRHSRVSAFDHPAIAPELSNDRQNANLAKLVQELCLDK